jgi:hypothetical protein
MRTKRAAAVVDVVVPDPAAAHGERRAEHTSVAPNTTAQEDLTSAGQRSINKIWEGTQSVIAIVVVMANMIVGIYQGLAQTHVEFPVILSSALFLVVGFYFSRTNHAAIGGVGPKPMQPYEGR